MITRRSFLALFAAAAAAVGRPPGREIPADGLARVAEEIGAANVPRFEPAYTPLHPPIPLRTTEVDPMIVWLKSDQDGLVEVVEKRGSGGRTPRADLLPAPNRINARTVQAMSPGQRAFVGGAYEAMGYGRADLEAVGLLSPRDRVALPRLPFAEWERTVVRR